MEAGTGSPSVGRRNAPASAGLTGGLPCGAVLPEVGSPGEGSTRHDRATVPGPRAIRFRNPVTSDLALLAAFLGMEGVRGAYAEAVRRGYLWHEFGDGHLVLPPRSHSGG